MSDTVRHSPLQVGRELASLALEIGAFRIVPRDPVTWASGFRMPVYNDNRLILRYPRGRELVCAGLLALLESERAGASWDGVAGTASAGIAPALLVAEATGLDFYYVRSAAKGHGLQRRIEGLSPGELAALRPFRPDGERPRRILLIEDLLSTGGSAAAAADALMAAGAEVPACLAIFSYGFAAVEERFAELPGPCTTRVIFSMPDLVAAAMERGEITASDRAILEEWMDDPFGWQERHA